MDRMYSVLTVKSLEEDSRIIQGIATTPKPDRMNDIIEPLGVKFKNPLVLLHQHDSTQPVGTVIFDKPTADGITFTATIPEISDPGPLRDRVETAWGEVKAGLIRAVSIGFRVLNNNFEVMKNGGYRYVETEVLELSLVSIPAQADATITNIKKFDTGINGGKAASGHRPVQIIPADPGVSGKNGPASRGPVKLISPKEI